MSQRIEIVSVGFDRTVVIDLHSVESCLGTGRILTVGNFRHEVEGSLLVAILALDVYGDLSGLHVQIIPIDRNNLIVMSGGEHVLIFLCAVMPRSV